MRSKLAQVTRRIARLVDRLRGLGVVNHGGAGVIGFIDVGSAGQLPAPWYRHSAEISYALKFEPRDSRQVARYVRTVDAALWSEATERDFFVYRGLAASGSSLFEQNTQYVRENFAELSTRGPRHLAETWLERSELDHVETVGCRTLDQVLAEDSNRYHFLKIDAQGAEFEILQGASTFLERDCLGLHLELFTVPLYKGIRLRGEVEHFLADLGFSLVKEYPPHGSFDSQNDCVFLRRGAGGVEVDAIRRIYGL